MFCSAGIGDLALRASGFDVLLASELRENRAQIFKHNYPDTDMIVGDIWTLQKEIVQRTKARLSGGTLDLLFATPPCQGMSKNGKGRLLRSIREGKKSKFDPRNRLIIPLMKIAQSLQPSVLMLENVPEMESTVILDAEEQPISVLDYMAKELGSNYTGAWKVIEFADFGVPQRRKRLITIFTRHPQIKKGLENNTFFPKETHSGNKNKGLLPWVTVRDAIADVPKLDSRTKETSTCTRIPFHNVSVMKPKHYFWVSHTPPESKAFNNQCINPDCLFDQNTIHGSSKDKHGINKANTSTPIFCERCHALLPRPSVEENGVIRLMKGYTSAYSRMSWDLPANTLTTNFTYACSDTNLHPEQHRVLSLYEALILHTIIDFSYEWERSDQKKVPNALIKTCIGESIPPRGLLVLFRRVFQMLQNAKT
ncbi:MAG: DNA cytosine methyltransferase [Myxococcota bacterium]|nr:DNA cytosine methyltransferase [Myxococcota bacterium]